MVLRGVSRWARFCLVAVAVILWVVPAGAQSNNDQIAKALSLMKSCGYDYHTTNMPTVWTIHSTGKHLKDIKVVVTIGPDVDSDLVIFVTVTEKRRLPVTTDFMRYLLQQNDALNQVKIGYDRDGDLFVRIDGTLRLADAEYFRHIVTQLQESSDAIYGQIEPQLLP